jgi:hypothetical protein
VDPIDYVGQLERAAELLDAAGMTVSIYNHQLCTLPRSLWRLNRRAISDWKNEYVPECQRCCYKAECGGFFAWNEERGKSRAIKPFDART